MISDVLFEARESIIRYLTDLKAYYPDSDPVTQRIRVLVKEMEEIQDILDTPPGASEAPATSKEPDSSEENTFEEYAGIMSREPIQHKLVELEEAEAIEVFMSHVVNNPSFRKSCKDWLISYLKSKKEG